MRAEVKVGLIVGAVAVAGAAIWWFSGNSNELGSIPFDKQSMDASSGENTALAGDVAPASPKPRQSSTPSTARPDRRSTTPPPARRTVVPPPPREAETQLEKPPATARPGPESTAEPTQPGDRVLSPTGPTRPTAEQTTPEAADTPKDDSAQPPAPTGDPATSSPEAEQPQPRETPTRETPPAPRTSRLSQPSEMKKYTIQRADRLIDLAKEEYGDGSLWKAIKAVNPDLDENRLIIGATIYIPSEADARRLVQSESDQQTPPPTPRRNEDQPASRRATYVVEAGDTLTKIATNVLKDANRWREIYELNRDQLASPDLLRVGMELKLPPAERE